MTIRARLQLTEVTQLSWGGQRVKFSTVYDMSIAEDRRFQKATPTGTIEMLLDNPAAKEQLELGKHYYVDFTPATPLV